MMRRFARYFEDARARLRALVGSASIEQNLKLLGTAGLLLFLTLVASLFFVQAGLVASQERLTEVTLPTQHALDRLDASLSAAFQRQAQLASAESLSQVEALRDRARIESGLRDAEAQLARSLRMLEGRQSAEREATLRALHAHMAAFLGSDAELLASTERRQLREEQLAAQLASVDTALVALIGGASAMEGVLRLEHVLSLRQIAQAMERGSPAPAPVMRQVTIGSVRGSVEEVSELVSAALRLGWLSGKLGLAPDVDTLHALVANEVTQNHGQIERLLAALALRLAGQPTAVRLDEVAANFVALWPRVADERREDSLAHLRRLILGESARAERLREEGLVRARALGAIVERLRSDAMQLATGATAAAGAAARRGRWASGVVSLLGLLLCVGAAVRIRQSVGALKAQNRELTTLKGDLETMNTSLEQLVVSRTAKLGERERALQLVLDSMSDGIVSARLDGRLRGERSKTVDAWFGTPAPSVLLWDYLFPDDAEGATQFRLGFEQMAEGVLPFELCADQMINRIVRGGQTLDLDFQPIREFVDVVGIVIAIRDVTAQIEAQRAERLAREEQRTIAHLLRDKRGFGQMVRESEGLLVQISDSDDLILRRRALHTLKGNCAIFGLLTVAELSHALETRLDGKGTLDEDETSSLRAAWHESMGRIEEFLQHARDSYEVPEAELDLVLSALRQRADYEEIVRLVESFRLEPVSGPLKRLAAQTRRLAQDLGKNVQVHVVDNGVRLPPDRFHGLFASLVHAVRNALDHGIESSEERAASGKPATGTLTLCASMPSPGRVVIELCDDGRGIDFARVRDKAQRMGLAATTEDELTDVLFADGFSLRDDVSALSGRGVGLSAVRAACRDLKGELTLESKRGQGTCLSCIVPVGELHRTPSMRPASHSLRAVPNPQPTRRMSLRSRSSFPAPKL